MVKNIKLAKASVVVNNMIDYTMNQYMFVSNTDKMEIPSNYHKLIQMCRFFYRVDPIAGTVMNKMVDCAISDIRNQQSQCSDEEFEVYNSIVDGIEEFFRNACLEYLLSGLVLPEYEWDRVRGSDLSGKLDSRRRLWVPVRMWFRDPNSITIKLSPVPNRRYYYVTISNDLVSFILSGGRLSDGTADKETYDELVKNYPEFVDRVRKTRGGVIDIRLDNVKPILGKCLIESAYPTPYMTNALEALMHKRNLRKMDYSIASRTIAAIQLIKLGSDTFPCTDESDFTDIKNQMSYRTSEGNYERMFQLFGNHTLNITWVYPDTQAMLNQEKYTAVNDDIIAGFGFPRTLITGETIRSNVTGGSDLATFSPIATMEGIRNKFIAWLVDLYKEIKEKNNFTGSPIPTFSAMRLYRLMDIATIGMQMYTEGSLSRTTRLESMGLSFDAEMENKKHEKEKMVEYGIDGSPPMPYSRNVGNIPTKTKPETLSKRPNREKSVAND